MAKYSSDRLARGYFRQHIVKGEPNSTQNVRLAGMASLVSLGG